MNFTTSTGPSFINPTSQHAKLLAARLAYVERHGARFLFTNEAPPAPGWPVLRKGKVVTA